jgi:lipopolysaccharide transport system permease protein
VIQPPAGLGSLELGAVWVYRELLYFLVWRDLKSRYKQTIFGVAWAIFQPLITALIFTFVFSYIAGIPSDGIPYPIFSFTALLPWNYFSRSLERASNSLVESAQLLTKVYFPRLLIPISSVLSGLVDFAFAFLILIGMMVFYRVTPTPLALLLLPLFTLLATATALGVGLWLSTMNVWYRDIKYITTFLIQIWMYATPIIYPISSVPEWLRPIYGLNPMVGVVEGFRWALLGEQYTPDPFMYLSIGVSLILLVSGVLFFRKMEDRFADVV